MSGAPRPPAVAGTFYPAQPERLDALVATLLAAASRVARPDGVDPGAVAGLLVPHAGLVYSGVIAALSWTLAGEIAPATIVLAGTDHQAWADGVGVWTRGPWRTPLGEVPIDDDLAGEIAALGPPFARDDAAHMNEHSLEIQLPLLLRTCPEARIVPLAVSPRLTSHAEAGVMLGRLLARRRTAGERILLVASSDLAHYPPARICEETDAELLEPLLRMDAEGLRAREAEILAARRRGVVCGLCGIDPVRVSLGALTEMGATRGILLGAATSADAGGDPGRTVGYAAAAFR
ncbi:MAG: AmmeMemoRadiSam system protein B [Candidatus Limnocylindrales bacterium]|jgi:AmmeMemoRadiSam system protein B